MLAMLRLEVAMLVVNGPKQPRGELATGMLTLVCTVMGRPWPRQPVSVRARRLFAGPQSVTDHLGHWDITQQVALILVFLRWCPGNTLLTHPF